jgi:hypothetical protein
MENKTYAISIILKIPLKSNPTTRGNSFNFENSPKTFLSQKVKINCHVGLKEQEIEILDDYLEIYDKKNTEFETLVEKEGKKLSLDWQNRKLSLSQASGESFKENLEIRAEAHALRIHFETASKAVTFKFQEIINNMNFSKQNTRLFARSQFNEDENKIPYNHGNNMEDQEKLTNFLNSGVEDYFQANDSDKHNIDLKKLTENLPNKELGGELNLENDANLLTNNKRKFSNWESSHKTEFAEIFTSRNTVSTLSFKPFIPPKQKKVKCSV